MYQRYRSRRLVRLAHFQVFYAVLQTHVAQPYSVRLLRHRAPLSHSLVQNVVLVVSLDKIMRHSLHYLMQVPAVGRKHQRLHFRVMHEISKALHVMLNTQRRHSEVSKMISLTMLHGSHSISVLLLHGLLIRARGLSTYHEHNRFLSVLHFGNLLTYNQLPLEVAVHHQPPVKIHYLGFHYLLSLISFFKPPNKASCLCSEFSFFIFCPIAHL